VRLGKLTLAAVCAALLLAALVGPASAGRLSLSALRVRTTWSRINWRGALGTVECEVILNSGFHERTFVKTPLRLIGFVTAGNINRCAKGSATLLRETLPWHLRYDSFSGALPRIASITARVIGMSFRFSEPVFRIECLSATTPEAPGLFIFNRDTTTGATTSVALGGSIRCGGAINGSVEGNTTNIVEDGGARLTVTLI
jgi:hypothetical protein